MRALLFLFALTLFACSPQEKPEEQLIHVDLEEQNKVSIFDLCSSIQLIPLETTDASLLRTIRKIETFNGHYYLLDDRGEKILVFNETGRFLFAIDDAGPGPNQYADASDFQVNPASGAITLLSAPDHALYIYNAEGEFQQKQRLPLNIGCQAFQALNADTLAFFTSDRSALIKCYSLSQERMISECYTEPKGDLFCRYPFQVSGALCRGLRNTVYSLTSARISPRYSWDFGILNNDPSSLPVPKTPAEIMRFTKDAYESRSVHYVFTGHGENSFYRYAWLIRNGRSFHLFASKQTGDIQLFEQTIEGVALAPLHFDEEAMLCSNEEVDLDQLLPKSLRTIEQRKQIAHLTEDDNFVIVRYNFK